MPTQDKQLEELYELVKENNKMLHKMHRRAVWGMVLKVISWIFIFGVPLYMYFAFIQPLLADLLTTYAQLSSATDQLPDFSQLPGAQLQGLLDGVSGVDLQGLLGN